MTLTSTADLDADLDTDVDSPSHVELAGDAGAPDAAADAPQIPRIEGFPADRLDLAREALAKAHARLVRAAARTGQVAPAAPILTITRAYARSRCGTCKHEVEGPPPGEHRCRRGSLVSILEVTWRTVQLVDVEVTAERPALAGWEFLAVVEPLTGGNLIRQVPGAQIAEGELGRWREGALRCDHCQTIRRRTETFVVRADGSDPAVAAGTYRQVGRNCLAAFLGGRSPAAIVAALSWIDLVRDAAGEPDEGGGWFGRAPAVYDPAQFLAWVCGVIREEGWLSRHAAREQEKTSTASIALYLMDPPSPMDRRHGPERERCLPGDEEIARAEAALAWARALAPASDYERNLSLVARQPGAMKRDHAGILASAVAAHTRVLEREAERDLARRQEAEVVARAPSRHVGQVKDRLNLELTVQRVAQVPTDYGALNILSMRDDSNNLFVWKTGSTTKKPGERLKLRGTVKKHDQYRGENQTVLTRCEEVDEFPPEKPARKPRKKKTASPGPSEADGARRWSIGDRVSYRVLAGPARGEIHTGTIRRMTGLIAFVDHGDGQSVGIEAVSVSLLRVPGSIVDLDVGSSSADDGEASGTRGTLEDPMDPDCGGDS